MGVVSFQGRSVDLRGHLEGYPYEPVAVDPEAGVLLFDRTGETRTLSSLPLAGTDVAAGTPIGTIDWNARTRWELRWDDASKTWLYLGDESNDEKLNVWRLDPTTGAVTALTDAPYTYGFSVSPDGARIATLPRRPLEQPGDYRTCLTVLAGGTSHEIVCDGGDARFTWSDPSWAPDGRGVVASVDLHGRRDKSNVAWIDFDQAEIHIVTEPGALRTDAWALQTWLDADTFVYVTDDSGKDALVAYDVRKGTRRRLIEFDRDIADAVVLGQQIGVVLHRPDGDSFAIVDAETGKETARLDIGGTVSVLGDDDVSTVWLSTASGKVPFGVQRVSLTAAALTPWLSVPPDIAERLVRCEQTAVQFPSWDGRTFDAFLYRPKSPRPPEQQLVRIQSFYGGDDEWRTETQVFCDAGIATFSPAVRGSDGYGRDFGALNDGDLGGDEIVDLFAAARWLEANAGFTRGHIGVYGRSHGGYAAMRALTFPPGTNGHGADRLYPFAFGISDAGFSDILTFYAASNIPDWVVLEAGDPATEADKLRDRSPVNHVDLLAAPLFLGHGENDNRVPVAESRQMAAACAAAGRPCTYVEIAGQGHRVRGLDHEVALYGAKLAFLERVLAASP